MAPTAPILQGRTLFLGAIKRKRIEEIYNLNYGDPNGTQEWVEAFKSSTLFLGAIKRKII